MTAQERNEQGFANAISLSDDDDDDRVKAEKPPAAAAAGSAESISQKLARIKAEVLAITGETVSNVKEANAAMQLDAEGSVPDQVEKLLRTLGI